MQRRAFSTLFGGTASTWPVAARAQQPEERVYRVGFFDMLRETLPNLTRLGIMFNPDVAATRNRLTSMTETARALGLATIPVEARGLDTLERAFATMVRERAQAFVMQGDSVLFNHRSQIAEMALQNQLAAASIAKEFAEAGFLLT